MENIYLEIGKRIRQQRKAHGLTREEFAENLSTTMQYISRLERAKKQGINRISVQNRRCIGLFNLHPAASHAVTPKKILFGGADVSTGSLFAQAKAVHCQLCHLVLAAGHRRGKRHIKQEQLICFGCIWRCWKQRNRKIKFAYIYENYAGMMYHVAIGVVGEHYLAEDAVHETFLRLIRIIDEVEIDDAKKLKRFLVLLTHSKAVDAVRKLNKMKPTSDDELANHPTTENGPEDVR